MFQNLENILIWVVSIEHIHLMVYIAFLIAILVSERSPETIVAWIFTITIFPILGFLLYLIFGINWRKNRIDSFQGEGRKGVFTKILGLSENFLKYDPSQIFHMHKIKEEDMEKLMDDTEISEREKEIVKLLYKAEGTYITENSSYEMFYEGKEAFESIIKDLVNGIYHMAFRQNGRKNQGKTKKKS